MYVSRWPHSKWSVSSHVAHQLTVDGRKFASSLAASTEQPNNKTSSLTDTNPLDPPISMLMCFIGGLFNWQNFYPLKNHSWGPTLKSRG